MVSRKATVFIVDDDHAASQSLASLVQSAGFLTQAYTSGHTFLKSYDLNAPGCLILDVRMAGTTGLQLQKELALSGSLLPVIMISGYAEVEDAIEAFRQGALDFLEKPLDDDLLLQRVHEALEIDETARRSLNERRRFVEAVAALTDRQAEVMERMLLGRTTKEIARELNISIKTVDCHRHQVFQRLDIEDVVSLVHLAYRHEFLQEYPDLTHSDTKDAIRYIECRSSFEC